jgi:hypothetical protein
VWARKGDFVSELITQQFSPTLKTAPALFNNDLDHCASSLEVADQTIEQILSEGSRNHADESFESKPEVAWRR